MPQVGYETLYKLKLRPHLQFLLYSDTVRCNTTKYQLYSYGPIQFIWDPPKSHKNLYLRGRFFFQNGLQSTIYSLITIQRVSIKVPQFNEKYLKYMPLLFTMFEYIFLKYI